MIRGSGSGLGRLRIWSVIFFTALAIPSLLLVERAFDQLKWEAFHERQRQAQGLAARVDRAFDQLVRREDARAFTDFAFLTVAGDPRAEFLQRSPLAELPPSPLLPGLIGYFQVAADGRLTTPLLPAVGIDPLSLGISTEELLQRQEVEQEIAAVLASNRLVERRAPAELRRPAAAVARAQRTSKSAAVPDLPAVTAQATERDQAFADQPVKLEMLDSSGVDAEEEALEEMAADFSLGGAMEGTQAVAADALPQAPMRPAIPRPMSELKQAPKESRTVASQAAFDRLSVGRGANVDLDEQGLISKQPDASIAFKDGPASDLRKKASPRVVRRERGAAPEQAHATSGDTGTQVGEQVLPMTRIRIFESEIDPLEVSQLDSGHLVLFRKVWRDGTRIIQGALVKTDAFIEGVIRPVLEGSGLAHLADLHVTFHDRPVLTLSARDQRGYQSYANDLAGDWLYQSRLSEPLGGFDLSFTVKQLGAGPGAAVIGWLALILFLVLAIGSWLMYRVGARQLDLVRQQQGFIYAVSHELKTPLTSIRMYSEMLREGWAPPQRLTTYYGFIHDESERLSRLIGNVLQLSRMSQGRVQVDPEPVSSGDLMDLVRAKIESQIDEAGFALREDCVGERTLQVDVDAFVQIMINLVDNALKFAGHHEPKVVEIGCRQSGGHFLFFVRDYGPGIPRHQRRRIFKLFYRIENELTRSTRGTGIGLALVRELAQAMDARVDVVNRDPGAEFRILFNPLSVRE